MFLSQYPYIILNAHSRPNVDGSEDLNEGNSSSTESSVPEGDSKSADDSSDMGSDDELELEDIHTSDRMVKASSDDFAEAIIASLQNALAAVGVESMSHVSQLEAQSIKCFSELDSIILYGKGRGMSIFIEKANRHFGATTLSLNVVPRDGLRSKMKGIRAELTENDVQVSIDMSSNDKPTSVVEIGTWPSAIGVFTIYILYFGQLENGQITFSQLTRTWLRMALEVLKRSDDPV